MDRLLVVIVNTATADLVLDCLRSMEEEIPRVPGSGVVIVDNPVGDDFERLETAIAENSYEWCHLIRSDRNGGFSYANNIAIREALGGEPVPQYIMLLNPDTIVHPEALRVLVDFMDARPEVGVCGSQLESADGTLDVSAHRMPTPFSQFVHATGLGPLFRVFANRIDDLPIAERPIPCDWVTGAALLARSEVFRRVGLLDDGFFVYFEETDLCWRAKRAGFEVWHVPASRIVHLEGQTTGYGAARRRRPPYWYASRRRFFVKNYGVHGWLAADALWLVGHLSLGLRRLLRLGGGSRREDPKWLTFDLLYGDAKALLGGSVFRIQRNLNGRGRDVAGTQDDLEGAE